jgi:hypothetical protein
MNKWEHINVQILCTPKKTVTRLKRQPTEWEKVFASYPSDKGLISRIYGEFKKTQPPKNQHPNEEMGSLINQGLLKGSGTNGQ